MVCRVRAGKRIHNRHDHAAVHREAHARLPARDRVLHRARKGRRRAPGKAGDSLTVGADVHTAARNPRAVVRVVLHLVGGAPLKVSKVHLAQIWNRHNLRIGKADFRGLLCALKRAGVCQRNLGIMPRGLRLGDSLRAERLVGSAVITTIEVSFGFSMSQ
ncbi:hypothetical protein SDC9_164952 [bioreactor metagenome]|uniref:Uncharacterized protein n=1 Tax=bioreactor metagenome TaxID=1076179 RepID=A0A645FT12_9ZZZZ